MSCYITMVPNQWQALRSEFFYNIFRIARAPFSLFLPGAPTGFVVIRPLLQTDDVYRMFIFCARLQSMSAMFSVSVNAHFSLSSISVFTNVPSRGVSTPRDAHNLVIKTVRAFVATAHGLPCQGCGPGRT